MALSIAEIREAIKAPKQKKTIAKAEKHEGRLRLHSETYIDNTNISAPVNEFLDWVNGLLPRDKFQIFLHLFRFPLPTVEVTGEIYNELERVFEGKNPNQVYEFEDSELKADWEEYRKTKLKQPYFWREKGWNTFKTAINSILIVDLPAVQTTERPEPYVYFLPISAVIDYGTDSGKLKYLIFKTKDDKTAAFDDEFYRVFENDRDGNPDFLNYTEAAHGLGYCPARFFWSDALNVAEPDIKKSPISPQLSELDWYLFFALSKRHLDLFAPYPIYSAYESECDFQNNETGEYCDGGYLRGEDDKYRIAANGALLGCPVCLEKRIVGVGSFIEVPIPTKDEPDLGKNPIQITTVDSASLDYNVNEVKRLKEAIKNAVLGYGEGMQTKQALNESQVLASFESRTTVLRNIKQNFEWAIKFANDTVCTLRYGEGFKGSSVSLGTEFYVYGLQELYTLLELAEKSGSSQGELAAIREQIVNTEYRNNPEKMQRLQILKHLEPFANIPLDKAIELREKGLISETEFKIKLNFQNYVDKFERENLSILEFGSNLDFDKKINAIYLIFKEYAQTQE